MLAYICPVFLWLGALVCMSTALTSVSWNTNIKEYDIVLFREEGFDYITFKTLNMPSKEGFWLGKVKEN